MDNKKTTKRIIIFITMLVLLGSMVMCSKPDGYPDEPDNIFVLQDTDVVFQVNWN